MREEVPSCPRCGGREATRIAKSHQFAKAGDCAPVRIVCVYKCRCGVGFTHTVRTETDQGNDEDWADED